MALSGPDCSRAVYGQVTMAFPGGNIIQEAPQNIVDALNLVNQYPRGGVAYAVSIRVLDANGISINCCPDGFTYDDVGHT